MAAFAPVAPIQILEAMKDKGCLWHYHLLLTHHVLEHPERFKALFRRSQLQHTIFMDNSIVELGDAVSDEKVFEACEVVKDQNWVYPVLIDVMADGPATIEASTKSYEWWTKNGSDYPLMVVLQGNSWKTFTKTTDYFLADRDKFRQIEYVGIPRILVEHLGTRQLAIQYVQALAPQVNIHLLGFSNDVTDDIICSNMPGVEGIDSAVPIRYAYSGGKGLYTPTSVIPPRPEDWFEKGEYDDSIWTNVEAIRRWCA